MENKIKNVRQNLEGLVEQNRIVIQRSIDSLKAHFVNREGIGYAISRHLGYVLAVDDSYKSFCEEFKIPYEKIKSENLRLS